MPTTVEEVEKLSWGQLLYLAGENAEALGSTAPARRRVPVGTLPASRCLPRGPGHLSLRFAR